MEDEEKQQEAIDLIANKTNCGAAFSLAIQLDTATKQKPVLAIQKENEVTNNPNMGNVEGSMNEIEE